MRTRSPRRMLLALVVISGLSLLPTAVQAAPCSLTAAEIDAYLTGKGSPLAGLGAEFLQRGLEWNVDPRLIIAIAGAESSFGKAICGTNNAWNWFWCHADNSCGKDPCGNSPFTSWQRGIQTVTKFIRLSYLNKGRTTIPLIGARYCASGCQNWVPNVTQFYDTELKGDTSDLGCAPECAAASCGSFVPCATPGAACQDPVCVKIANVPTGQCVEGTTACAGLADCTSSADCGRGICAVATCCGRNVCVPTSVFCSSTAGAQTLPRPQIEGLAPTIGSTHDLAPVPHQ